MTAEPEPPAYRPCVGIMLINRHGLVFVGQRCDGPRGAWQMPQGGIDEGESPRAAAIRELREEVGTDNAEIIGESADWYRYDLPEELIGKVWRGRYRGQIQKWFAMRFLGQDSDIVIDTHEPEFDAWQWVAVDDLPRLIVPFKREVYAALVQEFSRLCQTSAASR
ncbi:MAG: RNA pyrophosphohydrolase [Alphaproteobacteria bacterium]|nr:RNA pyrophosphohydrolase [Alphaproteobacteria bacterium]